MAKLEAKTLPFFCDGVVVIEAIGIFGTMNWREIDRRREFTEEARQEQGAEAGREQLL